MRKSAEFFRRISTYKKPKQYFILIFVFDNKSGFCSALNETAVPGVLEKFEKTEYAARLKATGVITSYICPLMYMNNPLCKKMPVITSSNKLRTYTSARYYTDAQILTTITGGTK